MTRGKKAIKKAPPVVIDPYLPANGNFGYRVSRYELDLEYKVAINRLSGSATITAGDAGVAAYIHPGSVRGTVGDEGVGERQAARPVPVLRGQAAYRVARLVARGRGHDDRRALRRHPAAHPIPLGCSRFRGAVRGCPGRRPTQRRRIVVSVRRPPQREGQLPHSDQHRKPILRNCQRRAIVSPGPRGHDHVDVRTGRTHVDLPGDAADRPLRPTSPGEERCSYTRGAAGPVAPQLRSRFQPAAADDEAVRQAVRTLSAGNGLHGGGNR